MALIAADVRLQLASRAECEALAAWLRTTFGEAITLRPPRHGRGGAWFVYGQLRYDPAAPPRPLIEVIVRDTGQVLEVLAPRGLDEPPPDALAARRQARLRRAGQAQAAPDDGLDRHELHKRLREQQEDDEPKEGL